MTLTFETTRELAQDYCVAYAEHVTHPFWYQWGWYLISGPLTIYIMIGGYYSSNFYESWVSLVLGFTLLFMFAFLFSVVIAYVVCAFFSQDTTTRIRRTLAKLPDATFGKKKLHLTKDYLEVSTPSTETKYRWWALKPLVAADHFYLIQDSTGPVSWFPGEAFTSEAEKEAFLQKYEELRKQAQVRGGAEAPLSD